MARVGLKSAFDMTTRSKHTKIACEIAMTVDGQELPSMGVLGPALEAAIELVQARVTESYQEVPARVADPVAAVQATVAHTGLTNVNPVAPIQTPAQGVPEPEPAVPFGDTKPWDIGNR